MFGAEVEAEFRALFDIYVNQVREIGIPASRPATVSAAALVDTAAALASGRRRSDLPGGVRRIGVFKANLAGAASLAGSRSFCEFSTVGGLVAGEFRRDQRDVGTGVRRIA